MKLELKHLSPYLPYGLKVLSSFNELATISSLHLTDLKSRKAVSLQLDGVPLRFKGDNLDTIKPILRPLSDLTKEITIDGETFTPIRKLGTRYSSIKCMLYENTVNLDVYDTSSINLLHYLITFEKLYEMHFDIRNLIEKGLAVDINTIKEGGNNG